MGEVSRILPWRLEAAADWLAKWAAISWRFLLHLPLAQCPACGGAGGATSGYYEPEWDDRYLCERDWGWFEREWDLDRFVGRIHPFRWPWVKLAHKTGHRTFYGFLLCKLGRHSWMRDEHGCWCARCHEFKTGAKETR